MKRGLLLLLCVIFAGVLRSQIYPVQISAQLVPPYSGYLPDYADPTAEKLKVILQFNDFSQAQYNVRLKFEIKGNGFTLSTKTLFNPPPITILPGQPLLLSGADLAPYLNTSNLDFIGINQSQYQQKMALPEGYYSICIKAYDYYNQTAIQISNEACAQAWFTLSDPPYLNLPICNTAVTPLTPQNVIFQWTPVNMASPNSAFNTEYEFALYESRPDSNANANQIVLSAAPIFSTTTQQTFYNYTLADPPLNLYMKYIWRVRVKDISGRDWFKNNGYSQICTFKYGTIQNIFGNTLGLSLTAQALTHRSGECTWTKQSVYSSYKLQVRKKNTNYWFDFPNTTGLERIPNLEPKTVYECRVRGEGAIIGEWSNIAEFKTLDPPNYSCNDNTLAPFNNLQPLPPSKAVVGLVIQSGQFEIVTTQIQSTGQPGWYKGKGYALIFGGIPVAVEWKNIFIDAEQRQQQGIVEAMTKGINKWLNEWDIKEAEENAIYTNGHIDSVYMNGNQICYALQGNSGPVCVPTPTGVNVVVVRDGDGNQWNIQLIPPPPKITGPTNYLNFSDDNLDATDNLKVVFEAASDQSFGFDKKEYAAFIDNYEAIKLAGNKTYFVPNKSVGESATDAVIATFTITGYAVSDLIFLTKNGLQINSTNIGNKIKLQGIPADASCIYAYCDGKKIGKLNIVSLGQLTKKLVIVPVNGANISLTTAQLNDIYKQANVVWTTSTTTSFNFDLGTDGLEAADANLLKKYSSEMRALRAAYQAASPNYDKNACYLFVVPKFSIPTLQGYMVRGRALGFVKDQVNAKEIAHELAHGAFSMSHTFPKIERETSNNLMDYGGGTVLIKEQWLRISEDIQVLNWLDDEEDASLFGFDLEKYLKDKFGFECYETYKNYDGIIPQCFWNNSNCKATVDQCYGTAMVCGIIDGVFITVKDIFSIIEFVDCWTPTGAGYYSANCAIIRDKTEQTINAIKEVCNSPNGTSQIYSVIKSSLGDWASTTFCTDKTCAYNQGRLIFDVVSLFYGVGEAKAILKTGIAGTRIARLIAEVDNTAKVILGYFPKALNQIEKVGAKFYLYVALSTNPKFTVGTLDAVKRAIRFNIPFVQPRSTAVIKKELKSVNYIDVVDGKEVVLKGDIDIIEEDGVAKLIVKKTEDLLTRQKNRLEKLKAQYGDLNFLDFKTVGGKKVDDVSSSMYNEMFADLGGRSDWNSQRKAEKIKEILGSGKDLPQKVTFNQGSELFKVVKKGAVPSQTTEYWFTKTELDHLMTKGVNFESEAGLPLGSMGEQYDIYKITAKESATTYRSVVAPTEQRGYTGLGGASQTLVLNRESWSVPKIYNVTPFIPDL
jgi:hypothetical protein